MRGDRHVVPDPAFGGTGTPRDDVVFTGAKTTKEKRWENSFPVPLEKNRGLEAPAISCMASTAGS